MKGFAALAAILALGLSGCFLTDLTPAQQASLNSWTAAGKRVVQVTATAYCVLEPTTSKVIAVLDTSSGTQKTITKIDAATTVLCDAAAKSGLIGAGG